MTIPVPMKLEHVVARAMARLRTERGWTQADLAWRMSQMGPSWTPNRVTQLETLRRPVSLVETLALAWVFEIPVAKLLEGDDLIEVGNAVVPLPQIRAALAGDATAQQEGRTFVRAVRKRDDLWRLAKNLGVKSDVFNEVAQEMYGRSFVEERDERVGDVTDLSPESARTKRGHITRALMDEMRQHLSKRAGADG